MTNDRVFAVFEAAILKEPDERLSFLHETCADDPELMRRVEAMLARVDEPVVIDRTVDEVVADLMSETPVPVGTQFGSYRVESMLGAGGMGSVYRATDTVLARQVAIKVLAPDVATDPEWVARFRREAQALAALNHPNVGAIYGFETLDGHAAPSLGLVLELVEGPTLAEKLTAGPLSVDDALAVAQQVAEALDAAHQQGIVHRDLKPGNIKVRDDGVVKVLDFGLATVGAPLASVHRAAAAERHDAPSSGMATSPGETTPLTIVGTLLGTIAYMSPEQAKGQPVTRTTDIWAFGCVLYEMLVGVPPFAGDTPSDTLALIVREKPDFARLPPATPAAIRTLLSHCLDKDQRRRWPDAASLRIVIEDVRTAPDEDATPTSVTRGVSWRAAAVAALALATTAALAALVTWSLAGQARDLVARVLVGVTPASQIARPLQFSNVRPFRSALALSPDGQVLAFVGAVARTGASSAPPAGADAPSWSADERRIYLRRMDRLGATPIAGTESAETLFFSPDGQWIGFWQAAPRALGQLTRGELKKVPIAGGPVVTLCPTPLPAGISWSSDGRIIFANHDGGGLWQVADAGGTPEPLTTPDPARGELAHRLPHVLPDGRAVLFTIQRSAGSWDDAQIAARSLVTSEQRVLVDDAVDARYVASGHLVYARAGTLLAQGFDLARLAVSGTPVGVVDEVMHDVNSPFTIGNSGAAQFSVAANGTLAYLPGGVAPEGEYVAVWRDPSGAETEVGVPPRSVSNRPRISPDGRRIAFSLQEGLGIFDEVRRSFQLLTSPAWGPPATRNAPERRFLVWHPDNAHVTFTGVNGDLYSMPADGSGEAQRLTGDQADAPASSRIRVPTSWSPDGRTLVFTQRIGPAASANRDIWTLTQGASGPTLGPFLVSAADEPSAELSPDGRHLAYESNQSGRSEIYVQAFPGSGRRELVSTDGGTQPAWERSGRQLFYRSPSAGGTLRMMAVDVTTEPALTIGKPRVLWEVEGGRYPGGTGGRTYDLAPDGRRFLMTRQRASSPQLPITHIVLIQNWSRELEQLARGK